MHWAALEGRPVVSTSWSPTLKVRWIWGMDEATTGLPVAVLESTRCSPTLKLQYILKDRMCDPKCPGTVGTSLVVYTQLLLRSHHLHDGRGLKV